MIKKLVSHLGEYKAASIKTPLFAALEAIMDVLLPTIMAFIIDQGIEKGDMNAIIRYGLLTFLVAAIALVLGVLAGKYAAEASTGFAGNLRDAMYENIQHYSFSNIDKFSTAGLVTRMTTDVTNIQNAYQMLLRMSIRAPASMIVALIMSFAINRELASVYLVAVILLGGALVFIMSRATQYFSEAFRKYDDLNESVQENVSAIRVVKAYVREDFEGKKFKKASENVRRLLMRAEMILAWNAPLMQLTVYSCILLISWLGAQLIVSSGATAFTTGDLMSMLSYCMNILMSLMMLSTVFVMITMSMASARRVAEVLDEQSDLKNGADPVMEVKDGSVKFDHVSFAYKKDGKKALEDINLDIQSGQTIGIIGGTGSGKSTLVQLLLGFRMPTSGEVRMDGMPTQTLSRRTMRDNISCVLQNATIYSGTIRDNVRMGRLEAGDVEIREALEIAQAGEFVNGFSDGIDHMIRQSGKNLSGGQKQRLSIARALLKNAPIYIFDDSFSALDFLTEAKLRATLNRNLAGKTQLIITQRVTSAMHCDVIFVMDGGALVDSGTHAQLLERCGVYREIYASQTGGNLNA